MVEAETWVEVVRKRNGPKKNFVPRSEWGEEGRWSFSAERKQVLLERLRSCGLRITEYSVKQSFYVELEENFVKWGIDVVKNFIEHPNAEERCMRRENGTTVMIQCLENERGRALKICKIYRNGWQMVLIPNDKVNLKGNDRPWHKLWEVMVEIASRNSQSVNHRSNPRNERQAALSGNVTQELTQPINPVPLAQRVIANPNLQPIGTSTWSLAVFVFRTSWIYAWSEINDYLSQAILKPIEVKPVGQDRAVILCQNMEDKQQLLHLGNRLDYVKVEGIHGWTPEFHWKHRRWGGENVWIRIRGVPLNLWNTSGFQLIGSKLGGLLEVDPTTFTGMDMAYARIRIRGHKGGFYPKEINVPCWGRPTKLRVVAVEYDGEDEGKSKETQPNTSFEENRMEQQIRPIQSQRLAPDTDAERRAQRTIMRRETNDRQHTQGGTAERTSGGMFIRPPDTHINESRNEGLNGGLEVINNNPGRLSNRRMGLEEHSGQPLRGPAVEVAKSKGKEVVVVNDHAEETNPTFRWELGEPSDPAVSATMIEAAQMTDNRGVEAPTQQATTNLSIRESWGHETALAMERGAKQVDLGVISSPKDPSQGNNTMWGSTWDSETTLAMEIVGQAHDHRNERDGLDPMFNEKTLADLCDEVDPMIKSRVEQREPQRIVDLATQPMGLSATAQAHGVRSQVRAGVIQGSRNRKISLPFYRGNSVLQEDQTTDNEAQEEEITMTTECTDGLELIPSQEEWNSQLDSELGDDDFLAGEGQEEDLDAEEWMAEQVQDTMELHNIEQHEQNAQVGDEVNVGLLFSQAYVDREERISQRAHISSERSSQQNPILETPEQTNIKTQVNQIDFGFMNSCGILLTRRGEPIRLMGKRSSTPIERELRRLSSDVDYNRVIDRRDCANDP